MVVTMVWVVSRIGFKVETSLTRSHTSINSWLNPRQRSPRWRAPHYERQPAHHLIEYPSILIADYGRGKKNSYTIHQLIAVSDFGRWHHSFYKIYLFFKSSIWGGVAVRQTPTMVARLDDIENLRQKDAEQSIWHKQRERNKRTKILRNKNPHDL